uniref:Putative glutathione S-transferase epsilon class member 2b n=1 Tax=Leptinotarsa decemlineata TaxID=7539 RepID=A0A1P8PEU9_LEPDE|nr:putative glutathione S-transferase epsilon class member 2b [Leptinotarsa decemlineata]
MAIKLFMTVVCPGSRAILACARLLNVEVEMMMVDIVNGEVTTQEFIAVKVSPHYTVPVLDDDGFLLYDSNSIMAYLVTKYSESRSMYPDNVYERAMVDQKLFFESGFLFATHVRVAVSIMIEAFNTIEGFLENHLFVAGNRMTIADISIYTTLSNVMTYEQLNLDEYPNIASWLERMDDLPIREENDEGREISTSLFSYEYISDNSFGSSDW